MPQELQWPHAPDAQRAVVETCGSALLRGELVALPTESVYVVAASALHPEAVGRLAAWRRCEDVPLPAFALRGPAATRDWVPALGPLGQRLARRCWPGPVVLALTHGADAGLAGRLSDEVQRTACPGGAITLAAPYHPVVGHLLDRLPVPLVLGEVAGLTGELAATPEALREVVGESVDVLVDDGPARFGPPTVVELQGEAWSVRRAGAVGVDEIARLSARLVLFVCTGNTCRSPLAEALCKRQLSDRLGCPLEELPQRGFVVASAGLAAVRGEPAAAEAVEVARELGADLSGHRSRPVTPDLLAEADVVIGMTGSHLHALAGQPALAGRLRLLGGAGGDLADPIGCDRDVYQACAGAIWLHLQGLVAELLA